MGQWVNTPAAAGSVNFIYNGNFEDAEIGLRGWNAAGNFCTIERDTADPIAGTASIKVVTENTDFAGPNFEEGPQAAPADVWEISFDIKGSGTLVAHFWWSGGADPELAIGPITSEPKHFSEQFTLPSGGGQSKSYMNFQVCTEPGGAGEAVTFWLDNIVLRLVENALA